MEKFIGTKIVQAEPMNRADFEVKYRSQHVVTPDMVMDEGYLVVYEDGYESWSPKEVFEKAYRRTDGLTFGLAIEAAKMGKRIARAGWNGKNQYVELAEAICYKNAAGEVINPEHEAIGNKCLAFVGTSGVQMDWLASQADMLAEDWRIVEG